MKKRTNRPGARSWPSVVLIALLAVAGMASFAATAHAQDPDDESTVGDDEFVEAPEGIDDDSAAGLEDIDELLGGEEEILAGEGYEYDPGSRRDPFKSLLVSSEIPELRGPRPDGIPGLLIDEVTVTGIFRTQKGYIAQVQSAANEKSFLLKEGDQLYDGDVVRITGDEIVFKQIVQDPTALKPFREVVKTLSNSQG